MRSIENLIPSIIEATHNGKLAWENNWSTQYQTTLAGYHIQVWNWSDENDGSTGYSISLSRGDQVVDTMRASEYGSNYGILETVFEAARRSYFRVDSIIDTLEDELTKILKD